MSRAPTPSKRLATRYAAHKSWAETADRTARTAPARKVGPGDLEWHVARLDAERFADATEEQKLKAAEAAKRAWFAKLAIESHKARRANARAKHPTAKSAKTDKT